MSSGGKLTAEEQAQQQAISQMLDAESEVERLREADAKAFRREHDLLRVIERLSGTLVEIERGESKVGSTYSANALRNLARAALHPAESFYACPTCGENVTRYGQRCLRCERNLEEDRLNRGE